MADKAVAFETELEKYGRLYNGADKIRLEEQRQKVVALAGYGPKKAPEKKAPKAPTKNPGPDGGPE